MVGKIVSKFLIHPNKKRFFGKKRKKNLVWFLCHHKFESFGFNHSWILQFDLQGRSGWVNMFSEVVRLIKIFNNLLTTTTPNFQFSLSENSKKCYFQPYMLLMLIFLSRDDRFWPKFWNVYQIYRDRVTDAIVVGHDDNENLIMTRV